MLLYDPMSINTCPEQVSPLRSTSASSPGLQHKDTALGAGVSALRPNQPPGQSQPPPQGDLSPEPRVTRGQPWEQLLMPRVALQREASSVMKLSSCRADTMSTGALQGPDQPWGGAGQGLLLQPHTWGRDEAGDEDEAGLCSPDRVCTMEQQHLWGAQAQPPQPLTQHPHPHPPKLLTELWDTTEALRCVPQQSLGRTAVSRELSILPTEPGCGNCSGSAQAPCTP